MMNLSSIKKRFVLASLMMCSGAAYADDINIYTWEDYFSDDIIAEFEQQTGHKITLTYYDSEPDRDNLLLSEQAKNFNIVLIDSLMLGINNSKQPMYRFSETSMPSISNHNPKWRQACGDVGIPYAKGTIGIAYRESVSKTPITSWSQLFTPPAEHQNRTLMIKDNLDTAAVALIANNLPPFSENKDDLKVAFDTLKQQEPYLLSYQYLLTHTAINQDKSRASLGMAYSGDIASITKNSGQTDWKYVVPDEGTLFWVDCLAIPFEENATEATLSFLNYINDPQVAIAVAEEILFSTTNDAAVKLGSESYLSDPDLFISSDIQARSSFYQPVSDESMLLRQRMNNLLKDK
ncbi:polyamine ABC transporter substrate-binding protein [Shewanella aestuarii]|uniref:Spermidine/putrescine ABC transporter substrate-binding protein n=1 Tax=Shewanella aestuarii TaxID=1028752 RepID=A0A6G9QN77_9GAMM|nr:spermidine/putrescine ABC transporter substrate-binding protein [Shewanella aestuarii]QIR16016.1 spermidine/putrescine ABC transporter substrate-binding protein [Shewanella aestuarii]